MSHIKCCKEGIFGVLIATKLAGGLGARPSQSSGSWPTMHWIRTISPAQPQALHQVW